MKRVTPLIIPTYPEEERALLDWANERIPPSTFQTPTAQAIGIERGGHIICAWVYHDMQHGDLHVSVAADSPRWASRQVLATLLGWPFERYGAKRLTAWIEQGNLRSIKLAEGCGFKREGVKRHASPSGKHMLIFGLLRKEYEAKRDGWIHRPRDAAGKRHTGDRPQRPVRAAAG